MRRLSRSAKELQSWLLGRLKAIADNDVQELWQICPEK